MPLPTTSNVDRPRALGYHARLDDLYLRLIANQDVGTPSIESIRPEATRINTAQSPEDFISETGQTFSRARFAGGEGLGFAHRQNGEPDRYWDSTNVDVSLPEPGDRHAASLLRTTESIFSSTGFRQVVVTDGSSLWLADGNTAQRTDDPLATSPTFTADDPHAGETATTVYGLAVLGDELYAGLGGNGIHKRDSGGTWSHWSDLNAQDIWAVKRRIVAQGNTNINELYEANSGGNSVLLATLSQGEEWRTVAGSGSHVLAGASDGSIYAFSASEDGSMSLENQTKIPFEDVISIAELGGIVLIGTFVRVDNGMFGRLWRGVLSGDGSFNELSLVRQWGDEESTIDQHPYAMMSDRDSGFVGIVEQGSTGEQPHLWRYNFATGGIYRHLVGPDNTDDVHGVTSVGGVTFFSVREVGLFRQSRSLYASSGYLITPAADFFTALDKSWQDITLDANLPTGDDGSNTSIEVLYATDLDAMDDPDSGLWATAGTVTPGSSDTFQIMGVQSRFIVLMVKLHASNDQAATPQVNSVAVTAHVVAEEMSITLPVNVSDQIELPGRHRHNVRGLGDRIYQELRSRMGKEATLELLRPAETIRGVVWSVSAPVPSVSNTGEHLMVCNVEVRGKPTT